MSLSGIEIDPRCFCGKVGVYIADSHIFPQLSLVFKGVHSSDRSFCYKRGIGNDDIPRGFKDTPACIEIYGIGRNIEWQSTARRRLGTCGTVALLLEFPFSLERSFFF
jgi:hypothetical protein